MPSCSVCTSRSASASACRAGLPCSRVNPKGASCVRSYQSWFCCQSCSAPWASRWPTPAADARTTARRARTTRIANRAVDHGVAVHRPNMQLESSKGSAARPPSRGRTESRLSQQVHRDMRRFMNLKLLPKILLLLGLLALVSLGATVFSTGKMRYIDDTYGDLIDGPGRANLAIARANRNLVYVNRSIYRLITEDTDERIKEATKETTDTVEFFNKQVKAAISAMPSEGAEIKQISGKFAAAMAGSCAETMKLASSLGAEAKK